jgi:hypothetical protein
MYTFEPILPDTIDLWPFTAISLLCTAYLIAYAFKKEKDMPKAIIKPFGISLLICVLTYALSYAVFEISKKEYQNIKMVGTFVEYKTDIVKTVVVTGKYTKQMQDKQVPYVVYSVDGGFVSLPASQRATYPEKAFLYKN